ncbi:hypothetical protein SNEBB_002639 [Seison nebaliae]|nr:hypothetical protein SNEBB_002639 [Seison nebaliae]
MSNLSRKRRLDDPVDGQCDVTSRKLLMNDNQLIANEKTSPTTSNSSSSKENSSTEYSSSFAHSDSPLSDISEHSSSNRLSNEMIKEEDVDEGIVDNLCGKRMNETNLLNPQIHNEQFLKILQQTQKSQELLQQQFSQKMPIKFHEFFNLKTNVNDNNIVRNNSNLLPNNNNNNNNNNTNNDNNIMQNEMIKLAKQYLSNNTNNNFNNIFKNVQNLPNTMNSSNFLSNSLPKLIQSTDMSKQSNQQDKTEKCHPDNINNILMAADAISQNSSFAATTVTNDLNSVRRKNATRESTATLKAWLYEHRRNPYPTKGEKVILAVLTKMTLTQVSTWFANARRRLKKEHRNYKQKHRELIMQMQNRPNPHDSSLPGMSNLGKGNFPMFSFNDNHRNPRQQQKKKKNEEDNEREIDEDDFDLDSINFDQIEDETDDNEGEMLKEEMTQSKNEPTSSSSDDQISPPDVVNQLLQFQQLFKMNFPNKMNVPSSKSEGIEKQSPFSIDTLIAKESNKVNNENDRYMKNKNDNNNSSNVNNHSISSTISQQLIKQQLNLLTNSIM